jgi:DNA polymerase III subunit epsilon
MILFIDTETPGIPRYSTTNDIEKWPRIVQLAWSLYDPEGNPLCWNNFIIYLADFNFETLIYDTTLTDDNNKIFQMR